MVLAIIVLIVVSIILFDKNSNLKSENEQLRRELLRWKNTVKELKTSGNSIETKQEEVKETTANNSYIAEQKQEAEKVFISFAETEQYEAKNTAEEIEHNKQRKKNTLILISGAVLIVLAALVFLTSAWNTIPDILKTGVLSVLIFMFFGISIVADKKFGLIQTSKAFYYIAMAYIPIVLLSISIFKLFGEYLSMFGEGKFVYFSICTIFLSALYLIESNRKDNIVLKYTGIFFQFLACVTTSLIFTNDYKIVLSVSSIISAILYFVESYMFDDKKISIASIVCQAIALIYTTSIFTTETDIIVLVALLYNLAIILISKMCDLKQFSEIYVKFNQIAFGILTFLAFGSALSKVAAEDATILNIINFGLILCNFYLLGLNKEKFIFIRNLSILAMILTLINIKGIVLSFEAKLLIMSISTIVVYSINYILSKNIIYKIITYLAINTMLLAIFKIGGMMELYKYIPMITTLIVMACELIRKENNARYYIVCSFVATFIALNISITIATFISIIVSIIAFMYFVKHENLSSEYEIIPLVAIVPSVYLSNIFLSSTLNFNFGMIISLALIIFTTLRSVLNKQGNVSTFFSGLYILLSVVCFSLNTYVSTILIMIWAILHSLTFKNKGIFRVIAYVAGLILYNKLIIDLHLPDLMAIKVLGYLVCTYLISRTILKNEKGDYKIFEYVLTSIIYIYALNTYANISDAMTFIALLLLLTILGYFKKFGPLFIVSLIGIVINFLTLTEDFWHSIPWWVYLLTVGTLLMIFAIRNEIAEKENREKFKDIIRAIKEKVDL